MVNNEDGQHGQRSTWSTVNMVNSEDGQRSTTSMVNNNHLLFFHPPSATSATSATSSSSSSPSPSPSLFLAVFPPPFRILSLLALLLLSWALTLHILRRRSLNPAHVLHQATSSPSIQLHPPVYHAAASLTLLILLGMAINHLSSNLLHLLPPAPSQLVSSIPAFALLIFPFRLAPFSHHFRSPHRRLHATLRRLFTLNLPPHSLTPFPDVILADLLTSLARPFAHLGIFLLSLFRPNSSLESNLAIALNCLPYLLRLKQCINDAILGPGKMKSTMNGLKYSTAIPMIILSSQIRTTSFSPEVQETHSRMKMWIAASLINSIYSTWWDNVNDWGIGWTELMGWFSQFRTLYRHELIPINRHHHHHHAPIIQQGRVLFNQKTWWGYLILMITNLILRMTWVLGVLMGPNNVGIKSEYIMQVLEVIRRGIWCVVRLEWAEMNRKKDMEHYLDLTSPGSSIVEFHENDILGDDSGDDDEKLSDGPILDLDHSPHLARITSPAQDMLKLPPSSSSSTPLQKLHVEFSPKLNPC